MAESEANPVHGSDRRPVGDSRTDVPAEAAARWEGTTLARYACGAPRRALDFAHRRPMARTPVQVSPYQTCHRRFQSWQRSGLLTQVLQKLAEDLRARGKIDLSETFIDASFSSAKKGALLSAQLAAAKAAKSWRSQTAMVLLSPAAWPALRRMKRNSSKPPSRSVSREPNPNA
jgi:hypothetical protein